MDKRCLLITYYFPPLGGGGVQRLAKLVKFASPLGWQFTVLTAEEPTAIVVKDSSLLKDIPPQTRVVRVPAALTTAKAAGATSTYLKRWLSAFLFVPDSRKAWLRRVRPVLKKLLQNESFDLILISLPPYSLSFLVRDIQNMTSTPVLLDLRDPWTLNPYKIYPTPFHRLLDWQLEQKALRSVPAGISAYQRVVGFWAKKVKQFDPRNWRVIPNGYDEDDFAGLSGATPPTDGLFKIGFSGTIYSHLNHPTPLFKALAQVKQKWPELGAKLRFVHLGKSHIDLSRIAARFNVQNQVESLGYLPHRQALQTLNTMNALCFVLDDREARSKFTIGGKVYEYLRLKKPILALVPEEGEAADLICETKAGVAISPRKTTQIADVLRHWVKGHPNDFAFRHIERFRRDVQAKAFVAFFEEILQKRK